METIPVHEPINRMVKRDYVMVGAYLVTPRSKAERPFWKACYDIAELTKREPHEVIYATELGEVFQDLLAKYPAQCDGFTRVIQQADHWIIAKMPTLEQADPTLLAEGCAHYKHVLVPVAVVNEMGGKDALIQSGYLLHDRPNSHAYLVSYNPRQLHINAWRKQVQTLSTFIREDFLPKHMERLYGLVGPTNYASDHPFAGLLHSEVNITCWTEDECHGRWGRWHRRRQQTDESHRNRPHAPETIFRLIAVAGQLGGKTHQHPWRCEAFTELLEEIVPYLRGVEQTGNKEWKKLARWIRSEAKWSKVKVPAKVKLPQRPCFKAGKKAKNARKATAAAAPSAQLQPQAA